MRRSRHAVVSIAVVAGLTGAGAAAAVAAPPVDSDRFVYSRAQCVGDGWIADDPTHFTRTSFTVSDDGDNDVQVGGTVSVAMGIDNPYLNSWQQMRDNTVSVRLGSQTGTSNPPTFTTPPGPGVFVPPGSGTDFTVPEQAAGTVLEARLDSWSFTYASQTGSCTTDPGSGIVGLYVNRPPVLVDDDASTDPENDVVIDVLANDDATWDSGTVTSRIPTDAEIASQDDLPQVPAEALAEALTIVAGPAHGSAEITAEGAIAYTPTDNFVGSDELTYSVTDNDGAVSTAIVVIDRVAAPVAEITLTPSATTVDEGGSVSFTATGESAGGADLGDVTDDIALTSDVATDVVDGTTVTFPSASPHTITATHTPTGVTASVVIEVVPSAITPPEVAPPAAGGASGAPTAATASRGVLPAAGGPTMAWLLAAAAALTGGVAVLARRRGTA